MSLNVNFEESPFICDLNGLTIIPAKYTLVQILSLITETYHLASTSLDAFKPVSLASSLADGSGCWPGRTHARAILTQSCAKLFSRSHRNSSRFWTTLQILQKQCNHVCVWLVAQGGHAKLWPLFGFEPKLHCSPLLWPLMAKIMATNLMNKIWPMPKYLLG